MSNSETSNEENLNIEMNEIQDLKENYLYKENKSLEETQNTINKMQIELNDLRKSFQNHLLDSHNEKISNKNDTEDLVSNFQFKRKHLEKNSKLSLFAKFDYSSGLIQSNGSNESKITRVTEKKSENLFDSNSTLTLETMQKVINKLNDEVKRNNEGNLKHWVLYEGKLNDIRNEIINNTILFTKKYEIFQFGLNQCANNALLALSKVNKIESMNLLNKEKSYDRQNSINEEEYNTNKDKEEINQNILEINLKIEALSREWEIKFQNCLNDLKKIIPEDKIWNILSIGFEKKILDYDYKLKKEFFLFDDIELSSFLNMSNESNKKINQKFSEIDENYKKLVMSF